MSLRRIAFNIPSEQAYFLEQECKRLEEVTGRKFTIGEVVQVLIEAHRVKMQMHTEANPHTICWMHRWLADHPSDTL